jgi:dihydrofolate reductase
MRKLILEVAISLDGYIEGPNGEFDWCFTDQDYGMSEFFRHVDAGFYGRKSYEVVLSLGDAPAGWPSLKEYVFSTTLNTVKPGAVLVRGNIQEEVVRIKNEPGKDIWLFGGAQLTASLLELGLVDELRLSVHPILLGGGTLLFKPLKERMKLELLETKAYETGLVSVKYKVL